MKRLMLVVVFAAFGLGLAACKDEGAVVAKVGSTKITEAVLTEKLASTPPPYQNYVNSQIGRKQFIDAVVRENIMIESAKQAGINKRSEYTQALEEFKADQERQFKEYKDGLLIETYLKELHSGIAATEADIEKYYQENKDLYDHPIAYTARHILVTDRAVAEEALSRIEKGEKFEAVAQELSEDRGSSQNGGLIGPFKRGDLVAEFEKAALALKENEMSDIVETPYGFHIIVKVSEEELPAYTYDQAKIMIKASIERERFEKWFENTRSKLGVTVNYDTPSDKKEAPAGVVSVEMGEAETENEVETEKVQ